MLKHIFDVWLLSIFEHLRWYWRLVGFLIHCIMLWDLVTLLEVNLHLWWNKYLNIWWKWIRRERAAFIFKWAIVVDRIRDFFLNLLFHIVILEKRLTLHEKVLSRSVVVRLVAALLKVWVRKDTQSGRRRWLFLVVTLEILELKSLCSLYKWFFRFLVLKLVIIHFKFFCFDNFFACLSIPRLICNQIGKGMILSFELNLNLVTHR